jgi:hypothetical protein
MIYICIYILLISFCRHRYIVIKVKNKEVQKSKIFIGKRSVTIPPTMIPKGMAHMTNVFTRPEALPNISSGTDFCINTIIGILIIEFEIPMKKDIIAKKITNPLPAPRC